MPLQRHPPENPTRIPGAGRWDSRDIGLLGQRLVRVFVVLRAFAALTPLAIDQVHRSDIVREVYAQASAELAAAGSALTDLGRCDGVPSMTELEQRVARVTGFADDMSRDAVAVLAVYLFEVVLVPLLIFWLGSRLLPGMWPRNRPGSSTRRTPWPIMSRVASTGATPLPSEVRHGHTT